MGRCNRFDNIRMSPRRTAGDQRVHHPDAAVRCNQEGVEIDFGNLRRCQCQVRQAQQQISQPLAIDSRFATESIQQGCSPDALQHVECIVIGNGQDPTGGVGKGLGQDTADTEHEHGSELRISHHAGHQFSPGLDVALDQQTLETVVAAGKNVLGRTAHRMG